MSGQIPASWFLAADRQPLKDNTFNDGLISSKESTDTTTRSLVYVLEV